MVYRIRNKYKSKTTEMHGKKFPSKLEADVFHRLITMQLHGKVKFVLRQVPFDLPGNTTHRLDFMVFLEDQVLFIEAKGRDLPMGKMKRQQVEDIYKITIHIAKTPYDIDKIILENTL